MMRAIVVRRVFPHEVPQRTIPSGFKQAKVLSEHAGVWSLREVCELDAKNRAFTKPTSTKNPDACSQVLGEGLQPTRSQIVSRWPSQFYFSFRRVQQRTAIRLS